MKGCSSPITPCQKGKGNGRGPHQRVFPWLGKSVSCAMSLGGCVVLAGLGWKSGRDSTFSCLGETDVLAMFPGHPLGRNLTDRKAMITHSPCLLKSGWEWWCLWEATGNLFLKKNPNYLNNRGFVQPLDILVVSNIG